MSAPLSSCRAGVWSGSSAARDRWPNRQIPGAACGRAVRSHARNAEPSWDTCGDSDDGVELLEYAFAPAASYGCAGFAPGSQLGRGGTAGTSAGPAGRGTGLACVCRASRVPSLSIALAP
jgi:hypothetical protein